MKPVLGQIKRKSSKLARFSLVAMLVLLLGAMVATTAQAAPPAQDPRGDGSSGSSSSSSDEESSSDGDVLPNTNCASLTGQVLDWGIGGAEGIVTQLKTGSWETSISSSSDGNYSYGGLGTGIATLNIILAPAQAEQLHPLAQNAAV